MEWLATVSVSIAVICLAAMFFLRQNAIKIPPPPPAEASALPLASWETLVDGHRIGPRDAEVVVLEWGDHTCSVCRWFQTQMEAVLSKRPDDVAYVYRHFPTRTQAHSVSAAIALECAAREEGVFWEMHRRLRGSQEWTTGSLLRVASESGLKDPIRFRRCWLEDGPWEELWDDSRLAAEHGATGTPTVVINGILLHAPPDSVELLGIVDSILNSRPTPSNLRTRSK